MTDLSKGGQKVVVCNAMNKAVYRGRFAPSPTGPMHFGTLIAAVGSYLQARANNGEWRVRIEDVDTQREVEGSAASLLKTLEAYGFEWHGEVVYQTQRTHLYEDALQILIKKDLVYPCTCTRKQLRSAITEENEIALYPGHCRHKKLPLADDHALRIRTTEQPVQFKDAVMPALQQNIAVECGDFVIKRRDGLFAYQLAVVVDDALQNITEVVRGADLLDNTPRQIYLQQQLGYSQPDYLHLPLALDENKKKLSKFSKADGLDINNPIGDLVNVLGFLGQRPVAGLEDANLGELWDWAVEHWVISGIPGTKGVIPGSSDEKR